MAKLARIAGVVSLVVAGMACGSDFHEPGGSEQVERVQQVEPAAAGSAAASAPPGAPQPLSAPQLPGPGELCPDAACDDSAVCLGGVCHKKCAQALPSCNDVVRGCTADEVCLPATSFSDACFAASARTGQPCGPDADGAICRAGNLCVKDAAGTARCLKLCRYGCPTGRCVATTGGCEVCLT